MKSHKSLATHDIKGGMDDDMRLLMNPDIGEAITDAAIKDAIRDSTPDVSEAPTGGEDAPSEVSAGQSSQSDASLVQSTASRSTASRAPPKQRAKPAAPRAKPKFASTLAEKHDLLFRMNRMATRGGKPSRKMSVSDSLDELRAECERMQRELDAEKSIKFQRSLMTSFATGVECLSSRFSFANLDGWSESIQQDIGSYDEVFEELHAKYATKSMLPPEVKLVMMVAGSAFMFHMSKSMFRNAPGMEEVMRDDPEIAKAVAAAVARKAQKEEKEPAARGMAGMFAGLMGRGLGGAAQGQSLTPPDEDEDAIERLFSSDGSESASEHESQASRNARGHFAEAGSQGSAQTDSTLLLDA